jgi:hypothetical protein
MLNAGLSATVNTALPYISDVLDETGQDAPAVGDLVPSRFTATLADGRTPATLVGDGLVALKMAVEDGTPPGIALQQVESRMVSATLTALADKRREVQQADIASRPAVTGYVRMLNPPSCARCAILAGKWFRWNAGFHRHPRCDCSAIPAAENMGGDFTTSPVAYFHSLSTEQQAAVFGKADAQAIRDGADINKVVNLRGVTVVGSGVKSRALGKVTVADIYKSATSREDAIRLLQQHGFIQSWARNASR